MKNINEKTKQRLIIAIGLVMCAVLVVLIWGRLNNENPDVVQLPPDTTPAETAVITTERKEVVITPNIPSTASQMQTASPDISQMGTQTGEKDSETAVSIGTSQNIQPDVTKPTSPPETSKTEPIRKPSTEAKPEPPKPTQAPKKDSTPQGGEKKDGKIYVPGFGWIEDKGGGGSGTKVDGDGDINKQVGSMGSN